MRLVVVPREKAMSENTLYSAYPSMFRNHPVGFSIAVLFMVLALVVFGGAAMESDEEGIVTGLVVFAIPGLIMLRQLKLVLHDIGSSSQGFSWLVSLVRALNRCRER